MVRSLQTLVARESISPLEPLIGVPVCIIAPTLARLALMPAVGTALPFATYFPAVLLATLLWGTRPGVFVLIVSGVVATLLFGRSSPVALFEPKGLAALGLFLVMGSLIVVTGRTLRQALISLQLAHASDAARKGELQHRLKNTLAIVQSLSFYISRRATDTGEFHRLLEARIAALAKASDILLAESLEACALPEAAEAALAPFADKNRLLIRGDPVMLQADSCEPLILALHELATNAHKYGSLSVDIGRVEVSWKIMDTARSKCAIRWVEINGPVVQTPKRAGMGQRLLARQRGLDAVTVHYPPSGLICELVVPVAPSQTRRAAY